MSERIVVVERDSVRAADTLLCHLVEGGDRQPEGAVPEEHRGVVRGNGAARARADTLETELVVAPRRLDPARVGAHGHRAEAIVVAELTRLLLLSADLRRRQLEEPAAIVTEGGSALVSRERALHDPGHVAIRVFALELDIEPHVEVVGLVVREVQESRVRVVLVGRVPLFLDVDAFLPRATWL